MARAANDVMQSIIFSAVLDAVEALKAGSKGLPNQMVRDLQAIHSNITFADLPKELQDAISASTRSAFTQLLKEGYAVGPKSEQRTARPMDRVPERDRRGDGERRFVRTGAGRRGPGGPGSKGPGAPGGKGPGGNGPGGPGGKGPGGPGRPSRPRKPKGKPRLS